jgi:hypothetical protein
MPGEVSYDLRERMYSAVQKLAKTIEEMQREDPEAEDEGLQEKFYDDFRAALLAMTRWWWEDDSGGDIAEILFAER